ncbi:hypothetical protein L873DRAFT_1817293 [Choiromyces venosus 120613-1]|uniref:Uncharacterized protein n=1 Tax=Choiromyces venosus 120613-1 TaxID=1336337 RepID=A0A3N4J6G9_9PEZI|nr:hypothetical protein L873DRAFT_1817293 [Choiromyces venosus 120613-1]
MPAFFFIFFLHLIAWIPLIFYAFFYFIVGGWGWVSGTPLKERAPTAPYSTVKYGRGSKQAVQKTQMRGLQTHPCTALIPHRISSTVPSSSHFTVLRSYIPWIWHGTKTINYHS